MTQPDLQCPICKSRVTRLATYQDLEEGFDGPHHEACHSCYRRMVVEGDLVRLVPMTERT